MCLVKQGLQKCDNWRDVYPVHPMHLALVTGPNIPFDVLLQHRPPEAHQKTRAHKEYTLVTQLVMCCTDKCIVLVHMHDNLVSSAALSVPQLPISHKEAHGKVDESLELTVIQCTRMAF